MHVSNLYKAIWNINITHTFSLYATLTLAGTQHKAT